MSHQAVLLLVILLLSVFLFLTPGPVAQAAIAAPAIPQSISSLDLPFSYYATQISSGWYHTCALTTTGGVKCWGRNDDGELGNNTWTDSHVWVDVWTGSGNSTPLSGIVAIAAGSYHTCALTTTGTVKCWGYNSYGQLGNNAWSSSSTPVDVVTSASDSAPLSGVVAIAAGNSDTCALTTAGTVKCWGLNSFGELGNNSTTNSNVPVAVSGLTGGVRAIAAGGYHTCALTASGGVKCWGYNNSGQLGNNAWTDNHVPVDVVTNGSDSTPLSGIIAVTGGSYHTCALTTSGSVKCWGYSNYGQLGRNSYVSSPAPVDVVTSASDSTPLSGVSAITAGENHTCALTTSGGLKCWGSSEQDQMGNSSTTPAPVDMSYLTAWVSAAAAGKYHTCVMTTGGGVQCMGYNYYGELGNNSTTNSRSPVDVSGSGRGVMGISAGGGHTCALTAGGGVKCWGDNNRGQLGNNSETLAYNVPVDVNGLTSGVTAVGAGDQHTCALTTTGGVKCWGYNDNGQLGNDSTTESRVPVDVNGLTTGVTAIGTGYLHTCALTTGGGVKCWGFNNHGQLGNNSTTDSHVPVDVDGLTSGVTAIVAGYYHTCALTTGGGIKCWGYNSGGQLGNLSTTDSHVPVDVNGLTSGVDAVVVGMYHTCALTAGGIKCWGWNYYGQFGNDSTTDSLTPVDVNGLTSGVSAVAAGQFHTCGITTGGGVKCWGWNLYGQLGNNSTTDSHVPVDVNGLTSGVSAMATGGRHTCALTAGGGVKCWGYNNYGQLGNNSWTNASKYVQVVGLLSSALPVVSLSANPSPVNQPVHFTATVSGPVETPGGTVQFKVDGASFGSAASLTGGSATSVSTSALSVGMHLVDVVYSGDGNYASSRSAGRVQAVTIATTTTLTSSLNPSTLGQTVTLTATVTPTPTEGTVAIADNGTTITGCEALVLDVSGRAVCTASGLDVGSHSLTAAYSGGASYLPSSTASAYAQTVNPVSTTTALTPAPNPSLVGQAVTLTVTVTSSVGTPTGTVQFYASGATLGIPITLSSGQAVTTTTSLAVGTHPITATYGGDVNHYGSTASQVDQVVNQIPTTTTLASTSNPSTFGQTVTLTATVVPTPTEGTVAIRDNGMTITGCQALSLDASGQAACTTFEFGAGDHPITATYSGGVNYLASSTASAYTQGVNPIPTTTTLTSAPNPSLVGQTVTLTATVTSSHGTSTGTVQFYDNGVALGVPVTLASGQAVTTTVALGVGTHPITATYGGDGNHYGSTANEMDQVVNPIPTTTTLASSPNPSTLGQIVILTATVTASSGTPGGTAQFYDNGVLWGGPITLTNGQAVTTTAALGAGSHPITATYSGEADYQASTSALYTLAVGTADTTTVITSSPNPSAFGQSATFTVAVTSAIGITPTGTISVTVDGTAWYTGMLTNGRYVGTTNALSVGAHALVATYSGDANFSPSTSGTYTHTVSALATSATVATSGSPSTYGHGVSFTVTVTSTAGTPGGTAQLYDNGALLGGPLPLASGQAVTTTSTLAAGTHPITATYAGDATHSGSTSNPITQTVNNPAPVLTAISPASVAAGTVTFTLTVTGTDFVSGSVVRWNGNARSTSYVSATKLTATIPASDLAAVGGVTVTVYTGAPGGGTSAAQAFTINPGSTTTIVTSSANPAVTGQVITFTAMVTESAGAGAPTGSVTFRDGPATLGTGTLDGSRVATYVTSTLSVGSHAITAQYGGDANHNASVSPSLIQTVTLASCTPALAASRAPGATQRSANGGYTVYLPFVTGGAGIAAPDLVVRSIAATTSTLQLVLANQGNAAVRASTPFWVDLYVNPSNLPAAVNQTWSMRGSQGAVWGVATPGVPLGVGSTFTLSLGDAYYWASLSNMPATLASGSCLYAQVDSANTGTTYGAVQENHELSGGIYNNILVYQLTTPVKVSTGARSASRNEGTKSSLPKRP